jgi:hypothetical protein
LDTYSEHGKTRDWAFQGIVGGDPRELRPVVPRRRRKKADIVRVESRLSPSNCKRLSLHQRLLCFDAGLDAGLIQSPRESLQCIYGRFERLLCTT